MRIGKRFSERCVSLQIGNRDVSELKYLVVHVIAAEILYIASVAYIESLIAAQQLKFYVEHLRSKFYLTFNCIYSKSVAANSQLVTVE